MRARLKKDRRYALVADLGGMFGYTIIEHYDVPCCSETQKMFTTIALTQDAANLQSRSWTWKCAIGEHVDL